MIYELVTDEIYGSVVKATDKEGKVYWIPVNEANSDYQRYLAWLENPEAEQSTPNL